MGLFWNMNEWSPEVANAGPDPGRAGSHDPSEVRSRLR